jgi:hypothetical protein
MKYNTSSKPRRAKARWQADMRIVFRRYAVGFGLSFGAVIALAPLIKGLTWIGGMEGSDCAAGNSVGNMLRNVVWSGMVILQRIRAGPVSGSNIKQRFAR